MKDERLNNMEDISPTNAITAMSQQHFGDTPSNDKPRTFRSVKWLCPKRYIIALLLCTLLLIQVIRRFNVTFTLEYIRVTGNKDTYSITNWTFEDYNKFITFLQIMDIFAAFIGALVVYKISSHTIIMASVTISSILHMLIPTSLANHSAFLVIIIIGDHIFLIPTFIAALSIWKDWAPPEERTSLVTISLCALIMQGTVGSFYLLLFPYIGKYIYLYYYLGFPGLIWVLIWFNITANTPQNDALISEKEYLYLESKISSYTQEKIKLKDVPWMSILKCKQIYILCAVFFKFACSVGTMEVIGISIVIIYHLKKVFGGIIYFEPKYVLLPFICFLPIILIGVSMAMDFLNRNKIHNLKIRKHFLIGGFLLQCICMVLEVITSLEYSKVIFFILAYSAFGISVPGCLTYPLDLSPRYVPFIAGIALAFFSLGTVIFSYIAEKHYKNIEIYENRRWPLFLIDGIITLIIAIVFGIWGDVAEQQWSQVLPSRRKIHNCSIYPKLDDVEEQNHVPGYV